MKKYIATLFALALAIGSITFVGCGGAPADDPKANEEGEGVGEPEMTQEMKDKAKKLGITTGIGSDTNSPDKEPK